MADLWKQLDDAAKSVGDSTAPKLKFWIKELQDAQEREKRFRENAKRIIQLYEGNKREDNSFNILYANTETLLPACFNHLPRPFVDRRFKDADPQAKQASEAVERVLTVLEDSGDSEYEPFYSLIEQAVLGALVPGRGLTKFKYDPHFASDPDSLDDGEEIEGQAPEGGGEEGGEGEAGAPATNEVVVYETICGEDQPHDRVLFGYARRWVHVPWVAFSHEMTRDDVKESFGAEWVDKLTFTDHQKEEKLQKARNNADSDMKDLEKPAVPVAIVWEIWDKSSKTVLFYAPSYKEGMVKETPDPHHLSGFFPCPQPLAFLLKKSGLTPTQLYLLYEEQARELNRVSMRINRVLNALKVRGFYDGTLEGLAELLRADDNTFLKAKNVQAMKDGQTIATSLWMMPLQELITVLQILWQGREQVKNTIYEITGISDIMRGDTQASETFGAQKLKSQWGTQRLQRMQGYVQDYVKECLRIMSEMAIQHFNEATWAEMTNLDYATSQQVEQANLEMQSIQQQMAQMPPPAPVAPPAPGQPPAAPQPGPFDQKIAEINAVLQKPKWSDVLNLLKNQYLRYGKIDIETNSTIEANSAEDKQNMTEALTAIGTLVQQFEPMVQSGAMPMVAVKSLLLSVARRFTFGRQVEETIAQIPDQAPNAGQTDPSVAAKQQAAATEAQLAQQVAQQKMQQGQQDQQLAQQEFGLKQQDFQFRQAEAVRKEQQAQQTHAMKMAELAMKQAEIQQKMQGIQVKGQADIVGARMQQEADEQAAASTVRTAAIKEESMTVTAKNKAKSEAQRLRKQAQTNGAK